MLSSTGDIVDSIVETDGAGNITADVTGDVTGNAGTVTTNANLTGDVTSVGNATTIANDAVDSAQIATDAVSTDAIAPGIIRFSTEMNLGSTIATWSVGTGTQVIPIGIYQIVTTTAATTTPVLEYRINGAWKASAGMTLDISFQVVSDGVTARINGSASDNIVTYEKTYN